MSKIEIKQISEEEKQSLGIENWSVWEKEISEFPWEYGEKESCYIIEGEAEIKDEDTGEKIIIKNGDFVIFSSGLRCIWKINKKIKKYYKFS